MNPKKSTNKVHCLTSTSITLSKSVIFSISAMITIMGVSNTSLSQSEISAQNNRQQDQGIDPLLDQLSKQLSIQQQGLERTVAIPTDEHSQTPQFSEHNQQIETLTSDVKLKNLEAEINDLKNKVDLLTTEIEIERQELYNQANSENFYRFQINLDNKKYSIHSMQVKLDEIEIYTLNAAQGLWLPSKQIPLYYGPLNPGQHKIDLTVKVTPKKQSGIKLNKAGFEVIKHSHQFEVPNEKVDKSESKLAFNIVEAGKELSLKVALNKDQKSKQ